MNSQHVEVDSKMEYFDLDYLDCRISYRNGDGIVVTRQQPEYDHLGNFGATDVGLMAAKKQALFSFMMNSAGLKNNILNRLHFGSGSMGDGHLLISHIKDAGFDVPDEITATWVARNMSHAIFFNGKPLAHRRNEVEQARELLEANGYAVDTLWQACDVQSRYDCDDETALSIMNSVMTNDSTNQHVWCALDIIAQDEYGLTKRPPRTEICKGEPCKVCGAV